MNVRSSLSAVLTTGLTTLLLLPLLAGLYSVVFPAFGHLPVLGFNGFSTQPWKQLWATPEIGPMVFLSLGTAILSTLISLLVALSVVSAVWGAGAWYKTRRWLAPMMAAPHVALAFGIGFVLMPSGLLARILAPVAGWDLPPDWHLTQDVYGLSLVLLLVMKETPFLIFMLMAAVAQLPVRGTLKVGSSLGYQPWMCWIKLLWPQLYPMIRLPVFTVLAFSVSVVDVALILGPTNPPTFAVQILNWLQDPDLSFRLRAAAGSLVLLLLVIVTIGLFWLGECALQKMARGWLVNGRRGAAGSFWQRMAKALWNNLLLLFVASGAVLIIWSFVWRWRFPSLWPLWSLKSWEKAVAQLAEPLTNALLVAGVATLLAMVIAVLLLELNGRFYGGLSGNRQPGYRQSGKRYPAVQPRWQHLNTYTSIVMYLPLLLPQMTFLFGIQVLLLRLGIEGHWLTVAGLHLIFVLPYCYLSLYGPWQGYDHRHSVQGWLLSGSRLKTFYRIKLKILWQPLMASFALGFAVSIAQYLPTLFASAGRVSTVTTEAVSLASGGNRRLIGVYALVQMLLPFLCYALAVFLSHWTVRKGRFVQRFS